MKYSDISKLVNENKNLKVPYPFLIVYDNYVLAISKGKTNSYNKTYDIDRISRMIRIKEIRNDIVTKEKTCIITFLNSAWQEEEKEVPCEMLADKSSCTKLARFGVNVNSENAVDVIKHLDNEMAKAVMTKMLSGAGFYTINNNIVYIGTISFYRRNEKFYKANIGYYGKLNIAKKGKFEVLKNMLEEEVVPFTFLSTALAIGASSLLVGLLYDELQIPNLFIHISGDSSTGKSTALMLATSLFGGFKNCAGKSSLMASWNTTHNALFEMLSGNYGITVGLDESGISRNKAFASLIYCICAGREKARMEMGLGNKDVREWHTSIISTGEFPLNDETEQATGQKVRMLQLESVPWTNDASHSERIKNTLEKNYGIIGPMLAKQVMLLNKKTWVRKHEKEVNHILQYLQCDKLNVRIANQLAIIIMSAKLLNQVGIDVDCNEIRLFLCAIANDTMGSKKMIGERAFEKLKEEIVLHQNDIEIRAKNGRTQVEVPIGRLWAVTHVETCGDKINPENVTFTMVLIQKVTLDEFLLANGYKNPQIIYDAWKKDKHIDTDKTGSIIFKTSMGSIKSAKCIKVLL